MRELKRRKFSFDLVLVVYKVVAVCKNSPKTVSFLKRKNASGSGNFGKRIEIAKSLEMESSDSI
ncbi:MAG: hypothetical protein ACJA1A_003284 [Saprospiraceae bacterium]|jgi:hypothetical protein|tara:strand:- start:716 stop:907 length:192 start_codon:yes stop_codon:yes gene_type:complete